MTIFTSPYDPISVPSTNLFDLLYSDTYNPPKSLPPLDAHSIVDPVSNQTWTRPEVYHAALSLSAGLTRFYTQTPKLESFFPPPASSPPEDTLSPDERKKPILIFSPNTPSYILALLGCLASPIGIIPTLANAAYTPPELKHQLVDSRAAAILVHPDLVPVLEKAMQGVDGWQEKCWLLTEEERPSKSGNLATYRKLFVSGDIKSLEAERGQDRPSPSQVALLCYSSGTVS